MAYIVIKNKKSWVPKPIMRNFDLNVIWDSETKDSLPVTLLTLQNAGYQSVALNQIVHGKLPKTVHVYWLSLVF